MASRKLVKSNIHETLLDYLEGTVDEEEIRELAENILSKLESEDLISTDEEFHYDTEIEDLGESEEESFDTF